MRNYSLFLRQTMAHPISRRGGWHKLDGIYTLFCAPSPAPQYRRRDTVGNVHTHNISEVIMVYHSVRLTKGICRILRTRNMVAGKQELDILRLALGYKGPLGYTVIRLNYSNSLYAFPLSFPMCARFSIIAITRPFRLFIITTEYGIRYHCLP